MNTDIEDFFYLPERDQSFTKDKCFLCGIDLTDENRTDEHIFPKWIQNEFNLWNKQIGLLADGRKIQYRSLTIPCCKECNGIHLSKVEQYIQSKYKEGYESFKDIDEDMLFFWLSKIFYGLLFKELFLPEHLKNPDGDRILTADLLEQFKTAHMFLQGARVPMKFPDLNPWSIFIFNTKIAENNDLNFDFRDSFNGLCIGIRFGEVGVIAVLQDNGAQAEIFKDTIQRLQQLKLHPVQFEEIFAKVSYKHLTANRTPKYVLSQNTKTEDISIMPLSLGVGNIYEPWCEETYSHFLSQHTKVEQEKLYVENVGHTVTYLYNEDESLKDINDGIFN